MPTSPAKPFKSGPWYTDPEWAFKYLDTSLQYIEGGMAGIHELADGDTGAAIRFLSNAVCSRFDELRADIRLALHLPDLGDEA